MVRLGMMIFFEMLFSCLDLSKERSGSGGYGEVFEVEKE
jgi:hypothetical protein